MGKTFKELFLVPEEEFTRLRRVADNKHHFDFDVGQVNFNQAENVNVKQDARRQTISQPYPERKEMQNEEEKLDSLSKKFGQPIPTSLFGQDPKGGSGGEASQFRGDRPAGDRPSGQPPGDTPSRPSEDPPPQPPADRPVGDSIQAFDTRGSVPVAHRRFAPENYVHTANIFSSDREKNQPDLIKLSKAKRSLQAQLEGIRDNLGEAAFQPDVQATPVAKRTRARQAIAENEKKVAAAAESQTDPPPVMRSTEMQTDPPPIRRSTKMQTDPPPEMRSTKMQTNTPPAKRSMETETEPIITYAHGTQTGEPLVTRGMQTKPVVYFSRGMQETPPMPSGRGTQTSPPKFHEMSTSTDRPDDDPGGAGAVALPPRSVSIGTSRLKVIKKKKKKGRKARTGFSGPDDDPGAGGAVSVPPRGVSMGTSPMQFQETGTSPPPPPGGGGAGAAMAKELDAIADAFQRGRVSAIRNLFSPEKKVHQTVRPMDLPVPDLPNAPLMRAPRLLGPPGGTPYVQATGTNFPPSAPPRQDSLDVTLTNPLIQTAGPPSQDYPTPPPDLPPAPQPASPVAGPSRADRTPPKTSTPRRTAAPTPPPVNISPRRSRARSRQLQSDPTIIPLKERTRTVKPKPRNTLKLGPGSFGRYSRTMKPVPASPRSPIHLTSDKRRKRMRPVTAPSPKRVKLASEDFEGYSIPSEIPESASSIARRSLRRHYSNWREAPQHLRRLSRSELEYLLGTEAEEMDT